MQFRPSAASSADHPASILMVLYALLNESVSDMLLAGLIPVCSSA
ncbi:MAG: hypothetical protein ACLUB2_04690 [Butyricicoccus pullicaecorum]